MILSIKERLQFQYLLPVQGNIKTLELVEKILGKVFIDDENEREKEFEFEKEEILFLQMNIKALDQANKLSFASLSVIRKIMEEMI